jgi:tetratricopeptide (TPR) repeat protein
LLLVAIGTFGWLLSGWIAQPPVATVPFNSTRLSENIRLDQIFNAAVGHMQQGEYTRAVDLWHQILLIEPAVPEVKVNMGFSLFEVGRYQTARDFFISAMQHNAFQANAYYGLAITSEKLGDLEGALGAMKSYIHLARDKEAQPFIRKARSAVWEWEAQLESIRAEISSSVVPTLPQE